MMPRFSLKLTLARLRTGIDSAGSRSRGRRDHGISHADELLSTGVGSSRLSWHGDIGELPKQAKRIKIKDRRINPAAVSQGASARRSGV